MIEPGVYILGVDRSGLFEGIDPEGLAETHPFWAADVKRMAPWRATQIPDRSRYEGGIPARYSGSGVVDSVALICGRCSSTMDVLRDLIHTAGLSHWDSLLAVAQKQGRGQKQRSWISPPGNLYVSWYWPDPGKIEGAAPGWPGMISLIAGELTATVLESFGAKIRIKWPNDLLVNDRKVCGILVEYRAGHLIVGIGLNLASAPEAHMLNDTFSLPTASLCDYGLKITPLELWLRLQDLGRRRFYQIVGNMTPEAFVETVDRRLAWKNSKVTVRKSLHQAYTAEIKGLACDGGLVVAKNGKTEIIYTGSILPADNIRVKVES
ncbi:MAG: biotin--[acetyl-CoA-carboxylase] ligase [Desulfobacteraceae bacterium]|nr:biotin--[acetyl-CoA-carboxylase] ligase [Desulfobacteraceae bacterium]MCF8094210.1 biotin--[acetyl-CoA-carboxylase] ligase [Desulfobacteraceae bacterium]